MAQLVIWRSDGLLDPNASSGLLRFAVADLNMVINKAAAAADLYREVAGVAGHIKCDALVLSTYAVTETHPVEALTEAWAGRDFMVARAADLLAAGIEIWPTAIFVDGVPDPHNDVHFDVVIAVGPSIIPAAMDGTKADRRKARTVLRPQVEAVLSHFHE